MPSKKPATPPPHVISDHAVYSLDAAGQTLGLSRDAMVREHRAGRLRVGRRRKQTYTLGTWLREWLTRGEVRLSRNSDAA